MNQPKPPPTKMDVHHPHHVTHKKKWSEYLIEFFLLFLAVYLGFLAENIREHKIEKNRGKQYIGSFYDDLKTDTSRLSFHINYDQSKINSLDHLADCYNALSEDTTRTSCLIQIIRSSAINRPFIMTQRTLQQLFNAGGFRLLPKDDADSIIAYQKEYENFQDFQATVFQEAQDNVRNTFNLLVDFNANRQMFNPNGKTLISDAQDISITGPILFNNDKTLLNKYFNELQLYYRVTYNHRGMMLSLKAHQERLLKYFGEKYHF